MLGPGETTESGQVGTRRSGSSMRPNLPLVQVHKYANIDMVCTTVNMDMGTTWRGGLKEVSLPHAPLG